MRLRAVAFAAALGPFAVGTAPALAGLTGAYVDAVSYFNVSDPPPGPTSLTGANPSPDCTTIQYCTILIYPASGSPQQSWPLPTVPVDYALDFLSGMYVSITDKQITITNNVSGPFCYSSASCGGPFSGFGFYFSSGVDITSVIVDHSSTFRPITNGLSYGATSITVNLNGEYVNAGDKLVLDVYTSGSHPPVPEPSTWAMMTLGFAGLGLAGRRRFTARLV